MQTATKQAEANDSSLDRPVHTIGKVNIIVPLYSQYAFERQPSTHIAPSTPPDDHLVIFTIFINHTQDHRRSSISFPGTASPQSLQPGMAIKKVPYSYCHRFTHHPGYTLQGKAKSHQSNQPSSIMGARFCCSEALRRARSPAFGRAHRRRENNRLWTWTPKQVNLGAANL